MHKAGHLAGDDYCAIDPIPRCRFGACSYHDGVSDTENIRYEPWFFWGVRVHIYIFPAGEIRVEK